MTKGKKKHFCFLYSHSNYTSLRNMTADEVKISPYDKVMMDEAKQKKAKLEKEEENMKVNSVLK